MAEGIVADISRSSFHDGYGIRTTVFFKGCPLHCAWCHNPECIFPEPQMLLYPEKCIGCGRCDEGCFSGARTLCGRSMTEEDVLDAILPDRVYYANGGGVTFSGGEPLMQRAFLNACIDACRREGIGCAVETSLHLYDEEIFQKLDFVMADLKIWDGDLHRQYTGVDNAHIKAHFKRLDGLGIPIIARTPVIPDIDQGLDRISEFLRSLKNTVRYELLPYHALGASKAQALGVEPRVFTVPTSEQMKELKERYAYLR